MAERAGLGRAATGQARTPPVARLAVRLGREPEESPFDWDSAAEHCRLAYLRGVFLARGSLSLAGGRTHLEFVVDVGEEPRLSAQLSEVGLPVSSRTRRGRGVLTAKSAELLTRFLRSIGAGSTLLEVEARAVTRTLQGELNRVINAEAANLDRAVAAAARQIAAIELLESEGRLSMERAALRRLARARLAAPEATLAELADAVGITRSSAQRGLTRFEHLAVDPGERPPGRKRPSPTRHSARDALVGAPR